IRRSGTIPELHGYRTERFDRCLRLRSVRGLGPNKIALTISSRALAEEWFSQAAVDLSMDRDRITELYQGGNVGSWQTAHVIPPLLRFLHSVEEYHLETPGWAVCGIADPFEPINGPLSAVANASRDLTEKAVDKALKREKFFRREAKQDGDGIRIRH